MPRVFMILLVISCIPSVLLALMLVLLKRRGVHVWLRTKFGPALVFDSQDDEGTPVRLLNVRGKYQSVCYTDESSRWELACVYHKYFAQIVEIAGLTDNRAGSAVVIGGGGYSFPKWLVAHCPQLKTTVVEIDPTITNIAREHFFVDELIDTFNCKQTKQLECVCTDGWEWLRSSGDRFDLIVNDAFNGKKPLGPLGTTEGAALIHRHLSDRGCYLANVIAPLEGAGSEHLKDTIEVFLHEFAHVWLIPEEDAEPTLIGNNALIASDAALDISHTYACKMTHV